MFLRRLRRYSSKMNLRLRKDKHDTFGFVESFKTYRYLNTGTISIMVMATPGRPLSDVYVYRGDEYLPLGVIDKEMGLDKYITAKKPFYSILSSGVLILDAKIGINYDALQYVKDKSTYKMYTPIPNSIIRANGNEYVLGLRRLTSMSDALENWLDQIGQQVAKHGCNRYEFLKERLAYMEEKE